MKKNKIALGVLCAVIVTGFVYNQIPLSSHAQQESNSESAEGGSKSTLTSTFASASKKEELAESGLLTPRQSHIVQKTGQDNDATSSINASTSSENKARLVAKSNQQPADHRSASQPKAHGHENQRRHPEDNSLIPPGEPKKPLPNPEG